MKYILILAAIVLIQLISAEKKNNFKECMKELGITKELLQEAYENRTVVPEHKCLAACLMKKIGVLETGKKFNMEKYREIAYKNHGAKSEEYIISTHECVDAANNITEECEYARYIDKCFWKMFPKPIKEIPFKE